MSPFIWLGRMIARRKPLRQEYDIFFLFPFYHVGGAEKVHADILRVVEDKKVILFFTRRSQSDALLHLFRRPNVTIVDISRYTDNKRLYFLSFVYRGLISGYIHAQRMPPVVFNGQSNFGYKVSRWIKGTVPQIELIHSFCSFSYIRMPFIAFYRQSLTVSKGVLDEHLALYRRWGVPSALEARFSFIENKIDLPGPQPEKPATGPLTVLYVGRGTPEKRAHLVAAIAEAVHATQPDVRFQFMGDVEAAIPANLRPHCIFLGDQRDAEKVQAVYRQADVLVVPSATESGPLVFMEGMAFGLAVLATPTGIMPEHLVDGRHGYLFSSITDASAIVEEARRHILHWHGHRGELAAIARENAAYAQAHFGKEQFLEDYRQLFKQINPRI